MRQFLDEIVSIRQFRCLDDFLPRGCRSAVSDVLPNGNAKQKRLLQNETELPSQGLQLQGSNILVVYPDGSPGQFIKSWDQTDDGRLPCSGGSDKCRDLPRLDCKIDVLQNQP